MKLIIDCDPANGMPACDVDDGLALAVAWGSPEVDVLAVTVVDGNAPQDRAAEIAAGLADLSGFATPVYSSTAVPEVEDRAHWRAALAERGDDLSDLLWSGAPRPLTAQPAAGDAPDILLQLALEHPDATLLAIGPLTNLAAAERRSAGTLARFAQVVVLGGAFTGPTGARELNFALDPEAAHAVLGAGARLTLLPLDVTRLSWLTIADLDAIGRGAVSPLVRHLVETARPWVTWIAESRGWRGANAHDLLAAVAAIEPGVVTVRDAAVAVELENGPDRSRPRELTDDAGPRIRVVTGFDEQRFMSFVRERLARGTGQTPRGRQINE